MEMTRFATHFVSVTLLCLFGAQSLARADDAPTTQPTAPQVIHKVCDDVLVILRDQTLSVDQKDQKIKEVAWANINFEVMSRLCIGRSWRDLSDDQKKDYQEQFKLLVTNTYLHLMDDYTDQDVNYLGDRQEQDGDWTVQTEIVGMKNRKRNQEEAKVDYRLRNRDNQWKVIDLTIENASLVSNYRAQFQAIISNGGIDNFLKTLHDKNAANDK
jgi:phospholipid transport system substrate-binding protein